MLNNNNNKNTDTLLHTMKYVRACALALFWSLILRKSHNDQNKRTWNRSSIRVNTLVVIKSPLIAVVWHPSFIFLLRITNNCHSNWSNNIRMLWLFIKWNLLDATLDECVCGCVVYSVALILWYVCAIIINCV